MWRYASKKITRSACAREAFLQVALRACLKSLRGLCRMGQWSRQKSGGDSAVSPEFVIAGMIFHPSRVESELLYKYIEQSFVELTLLPACHREDVGLLTQRHAQVLSAHQIERLQRSVEMKV